MLRLNSRQNALRLIADNPDWKIIDVGAGRFPISRANVATDVEPWDEVYENRSAVFIQTESLSGFQNNEFDFAWCSHVLEHVTNPSEFLSEMQRIARAGYIEVPTPLFCNLVRGNEIGHKSHIRWDPDNDELVISPHRQLLTPILHHSELKLLYPLFRPEMVTELVWHTEIKFRLVEEQNFPEERFWFDVDEEWQQLGLPLNSYPFEMGAASRLRFQAQSRPNSRFKTWLGRKMRSVIPVSKGKSCAANEECSNF